MEISSVERPRAICDAVAEDKISKRPPVFTHDAILRPPFFYSMQNRIRWCRLYELIPALKRRFALTRFLNHLKTGKF